jgi:predicted aspartyl protease
MRPDVLREGSVETSRPLAREMQTLQKTHRVKRIFVTLLIGYWCGVCLCAIAEPALGQSPTTNIVTPAVIDETLDVVGDPIIGRNQNSRMSVPVVVDGRKTYRFIVDSGADRTVISGRIADELALVRAGSVTMNSISGTSQVETVRLSSIRIGTHTVSAFDAPILRERDLGAAGMLGIDALANRRIMLDFERHEIALEDDRRLREPELPDDIVVIARRRKGQLILTEAYALGAKVSAVIDTGAQATIGNLALRERLMRKRRPPVFVKVQLTSVTGAEVTAEAAVIPELRLGAAVLKGVTIAFADLPPFKLFGLSDEPALLLGTDVLSSFRRVHLDFARRRVRFQLKRG